MKSPSRTTLSACPGGYAGSAGTAPTPTQISGVSRRDFLIKGSAALAITAIWGCAGSSLTDPLTSAATVNLADYPALATVGNAVKIWVGAKTPVGIIQSSAGTFEAFSLTCPHQGGIMNTGSGAVPFSCSNHGAQFNAQGRWVGGQQTSNLTRYSVTFNATAGTLTIQP